MTGIYIVCYALWHRRTVLEVAPPMGSCNVLGRFSLMLGFVFDPTIRRIPQRVVGIRGQLWTHTARGRWVWRPWSLF